MEIVTELTQKVTVKMEGHSERETLTMGARLLVKAQWMLVAVLVASVVDPC